MPNCLDISCPKCGNEDLTKLKNRDSSNWGKTSIFVCDMCGETFGMSLNLPKKRQENSYERLVKKAIC